MAHKKRAWNFQAQCIEKPNKDAWISTVIEKKVQSEIDLVIGQTRQPSLDDRMHMPYTYAVIHAIQRFANIVPFTPPRVANKDTTVAGCLIPKGVMVMPMLKPILQDKIEYITPHEFNPAYFLDENGKFLNKDNFIPFSIGTVCHHKGYLILPIYCNVY
ncbi:cytochrome P450 2A4-like isoform X2 [Myxocyprinus asiaticus]|uniref:cytochrome P450 2A4-like isoform X2 n=1 Tax=Myxocyprinus asiaticus TaxID=70543 RepID=UPI002223A622|nr:cytochrome P450 2A4-like isoform X2 [Myxocyprinus asiaticus]